MCTESKGIQTHDANSRTEWPLRLGPYTTQATRQMVLARDGQRQQGGYRRVFPMQKFWATIYQLTAQANKTPRTLQPHKCRLPLTAQRERWVQDGLTSYRYILNVHVGVQS